VPETRLILQTQEILDEARELLDVLPPLSPDHESVRLAVVKLRHTQESINRQSELSSKQLAHSRETIEDARRVVDVVRATVKKRNNRRVQAVQRRDGDGGIGASPSQAGPVTVFLDMDTVVLARHQGRYGPELGLQADLSEAIGRLFEIADRVVLLVNPPLAGTNHGLDTAHRVAKLRSGLVDNHDGLVVATCPHGEDGSCDCAKPGHGLITPHLDAGRRAEDGWYIGGDQDGMVAGRGAGLRTVRIGPHGEDHLSVVHRPDYEARDLMDAANHIMIEALTAP
jgi:hypothetical protein